MPKLPLLFEFVSSSFSDSFPQSVWRPLDAEAETWSSYHRFGLFDAYLESYTHPHLRGTSLGYSAIASFVTPSSEGPRARRTRITAAQLHIQPCSNSPPAVSFLREQGFSEAPGSVRRSNTFEREQNSGISGV
ncbi:hypothetical protein C8F04DRAFT_1193097 [Mycena alexandri]|uniref:Uncharacterized protein n=1 Tax=Mycena alexandri TaxID=1745969 RepID=A0AAD6SBT9_9AGAR|nr:hypothetical protein C8F04DRAFT_1193097 [Mycena alexandri]